MNSMIGIFFLFGIAAASNYSYPRILIIGPTGVGKSSLGNVLAGCEPSDEECFFPICDGIDSCTKETTIAEATFLGQLAGESTEILDGNVTLIDSPGFGDTDLEEPALISEMISVLKNNLEDANTILLCFEKGRWNAGILKMIEELESLFGRDRLWNNVILEITKWAFDSKSIADRERQGITEAGTLAGINKKLQENFHLNHSLPGVFIDSYAVYYLETDEVQKQYFFNYSLELWEAANAMEPFSFYTIEDILNQLHTCQIQNDCLNEVLEERITNIENNVENIENNVENIENNVENIENNVENIENNVDIINSTVANNAVSINDLTSSVTTNINDIIELSNDVADNAQSIDDLVVTDSNFNDRIDHFNERLNDNTMKIVDNQFAIQLNDIQIDNNKNNIKTNTDDIATNTDDISTNTDDIATNTGKIATNTGKIATNTGDIATNTDDIATNTGDIATNTGFVSYCGYRQSTTSTGTTLIYDRLFTSVNSFSVGELDIATGVFTAPTDGTYLVTQNLVPVGVWIPVEVYINKNGHDLDEGRIRSYSVDANDRDMTGRTITLDLNKDDKLYLHVKTNDGTIYYSTFCISLLHLH